MLSYWQAIGDDPVPMLNNRGTVVSLDTETTGLEFYDDVLGMSLAWRDTNGKMQSVYLTAPTGQMSLVTAYKPLPVFDIRELITELCLRHKLVFHNEVFDRRMMHRIDMVHPDPVFPTDDTMHLAGLLEWQKDRHLVDLHRKYVGGRDEAWEEMKGKRKRLSEVPLEQVAQYGRGDAVKTLEVEEVLLPRVRDHATYRSDREYAALVMRMMRNGLRLNFEWCQRKKREFTDRMVGLNDILAGEGLRYPASNQDVAYFLFKHLGIDQGYASSVTKTKNAHFPYGIPSVDQDTIEAVADLHPTANLIKEWRQLAGAISEYLDGYREHACIDGKVHALLDPFGTVSSRMAASHPNVMAIPMEDRGAAFGGLTGMFVSEFVGQKLWACDMSQAEVRLAAVYAQETPLLEALSREDDPYIAMAMRVWGDPAKRNSAKRATLASIYEVGADKFSKTHHVPIEDAVQILADFRRFYPRIKLASSMAINRATRLRYVEGYTGRRRWLGPDEQEHKAFNQIIQMGIADIMKTAMLATCQIAPLKLQIHDSLVFSLPTAKVKQANMKKDIQAALAESVPHRFSSKVPFPSKFKEWQ